MVTVNYSMRNDNLLRQKIQRKRGNSKMPKIDGYCYLHYIW